MINQTDATLKEVLSQASSTEAVKLLPWCISTVVPFYYISEATTMTAQQDKGISIVSRPHPTVPEPDPHGLLVPGPPGVLTPPLVTSPPPVSSLPDISVAGTLLLGCPTGGLANPDEVVTSSSKSTEDWTSSDIGLLKGNMANSDLDMASRDCLSCSDTDHISMQTA